MQNSWLKVTRLFHSSNIALELFRICSKGISPFFIISTTIADQRLLLDLINTLANMRETCFCPASTLEEHIKLGHGHWCGSHVGSCFKSLLCPDNGLISSIFVTCWKAETGYIIDMRSHRTDPHNCLLQLAHVSYHQRNSNLTETSVRPTNFHVF